MTHTWRSQGSEECSGRGKFTNGLMMKTPGAWSSSCSFSHGSYRLGYLVSVADEKQEMPEVGSLGEAEVTPSGSRKIKVPQGTDARTTRIIADWQTVGLEGRG